MTRNIHWLLFVSTIFSSCQEDMHKDFYANGMIKYEVPLLNGKKHGKSTNYDSLGRILQISQWKDGLLNGSIVNYFPDGKVKDSTYFLKNIQSGFYFRYDSIGNLVENSNFLNGKLNGESLFYENSSLSLRAQFVNDTLDGSYMKYYPNGTIEEYLYLDKGEVLYSKNYDKRGNLLKYILPVIAKITGISEGQNMYNNSSNKILSIELRHSIFDKPKIGIIIGNLNRDKTEILDTLKIFEMTGLKFEMELDTSLPEPVEGFLFEINSESNEFDGFQYFSTMNGSD